MKYIVSFSLFVSVISLSVFIMHQITNVDHIQTRTTLTVSTLALDGFKRATGEYTITFPEDFGPHPDFQTEWWYYTGNLETPDGRHFGYQLTIFRRALLPPRLIGERASEWATEQVYLGHFALTDTRNNSHDAFERYGRGSAGIAGAQAVPYRVWLDDWTIAEIEKERIHLFARQDGIEIDLTLVDVKGPVLQGINGYSQKGPDPGNASYYYSQTRLQTTGVIKIGRHSFDVAGYSWKDHEFSTSALTDEQIGWDWFALQLDDNTELKVFHIRKADGTIDPYSSGSYVNQDGEVTLLARDAFMIDILATWKSPKTGAEYPARWRISVPELRLDIELRPYVNDQELNVSYSYWEGAVFFQGTREGIGVTGQGYVEMTGYAGSMAGEF